MVFRGITGHWFCGVHPHVMLIKGYGGRLLFARPKTAANRNDYCPVCWKSWMDECKARALEAALKRCPDAKRVLEDEAAG